MASPDRDPMDMKRARSNADLAVDLTEEKCH